MLTHSLRIAIPLEIPPTSVGTQIVVAVIVGLLIAFAVQFLLTNLGLALGISLLKYRPQTSSKEVESSQSESDGISVNISFLAGLGILATLNSVLFIACFLAVRFSTASDPVSGATLGIVIWSTYFLILIWASYSAVGSVTGWVFGSVATKLRQLIKAIATLSETEPASKPLTEAAAANLIQQEIQAALSEFDLEQHIDEYLETTTSELDLTTVSQRFADLLAELNLESLAATNQLPQIDRQTFVNLINQRTNLSNSEAERVVERLEGVWQQATKRYEKSDLNQELLQFLQSADPEELEEQLAKLLEDLVDKDSEPTTVDETDEIEPVNEVETNKNYSLSNKSLIPDWKTIKNTLVKRVDLSDMELENVWHTLQSLYQQVSPSESVTNFNTISNDVEDYLSQASTWTLNCERGWQEFKEVIYDPEADPARVRSQLEQVQPQYLVKLLQQRDDLDAEINEIVEHLEAVRQEVFLSIEKAELSAQKQQLSQFIQDYLQQVEPEELQSNLSGKLERLLIESGFSVEVLTEFLEGWQYLDWQSSLQQRQDLEPNKVKQIVNQLSEIADSLSEEVAAWQVQITCTVKELQHKLESYLRYTNLDLLTPEKIDTKLKQLWQQAVNNLPKQQLLPDIELDEPINILNKRQGIETEQVERITAQIKTNWQQLNGLATPENSELQTKSVELSESLVDYLADAIAKNLDDLELEADLLPLLDFTQSKTKTVLNQQLSQLDWNEIEAKLIQVQQGSEKQVSQKIKQAKELTYKLAKLPRRWAIRGYQQTKDVVEELKDFLSYSNKIEFDSERLQHHLKSIFHSSKKQSDDDSNFTAENLDRLSANITQSLANRQDLTPVEVTQISDRSTVIIHQLSQEITTQQEQANHLVTDLQDRLGEYFSSLNLVDLNRDKLALKNTPSNNGMTSLRIKELANFDFQSLSDSWQKTIAEIPIDELGDYLEKISHDLSTIIDTEQLHDSTMQPIQEIQDYIYQQFKTIKTTAYQRTENLKQQTLQQVETTRTAIATAAYWMFAITFTSVIASAWAGFLATIVF